MLSKQLLAIPGLMTREEMELLGCMARSARSIIELGSYKGRSLALMGLASPGACLWGVDWFGDMSYRGYKGSTEAETQANLAKIGVKAELLVGLTHEVAPTFTETADLLHIDAGHSYEEATRDLNDWTPKVNPGGGLCVHDYGHAHKAQLDRPEVMRAVDDWRNENWTEVEHAGTMIAFRHLVAERGALYVVYGEKAREQALESIATVREYAPELPIAVVSDRPLEGADYQIYHVDADPGARTIKTRMYSLSPFRETMFLDADTRLLQDPAAGFDLLKYADVVLSQDPVRIFADQTWPHLDPQEVKTTRAEVPAGGRLCYWNSGVVFFGRSIRAKELFQAWHAEWQRWGKHDQMALLRALHKHPVRMVAVRECWNTHKKALAQFVFHNHRTARREGAPG